MSPPLWGDCGGREEDEPVISVYITGFTKGYRVAGG